MKITPQVIPQDPFIPLCERDEYGKRIVAWDGKPTYKQRGAVKWE